MVAAPRFSRRWLLVAAGAAGLVGLGVAPGVLPAVSTAGTAPEQLRDRLRASAAQPYVGYAESNGRLGLPQLPQLEQVTGLLTGTTRIRAFVAGPDRWRVDELTPAGERGTYHCGDAEAVWDFGANQLTRVVGTTPVRLPRAADLVPPDLARRLVGATRADPVTGLAARRIAGRDAAGLRVVPADPGTTVGRVDVWADPVSALPLRVEVAGRGDAAPVLITELRDVDLCAPADDVLVPTVPPGAGSVTARAADVAGVLRAQGAPEPPLQLAGRARVRLPGDSGDALPGVGLYGTGLAAFVLVPVSRRIAAQVIDDAGGAGGTSLDIPGARAVRVGTPLLSLVARTVGRRGGAFLAGAVVPELLEQAARELPVGGRV